MKHEVVFIKSAIYGRMRIGRCITAEEIETLRSHYIGCSKNVLSLIDRKCFGKTECEIRVAEISVENIRPCPPGLNVYLEVSYDCINSKSSNSFESFSLNVFKAFDYPSFLSYFTMLKNVVNDLISFPFLVFYDNCSKLDQSAFRST